MIRGVRAERSDVSRFREDSRSAAFSGSGACERNRQLGEEMATLRTICDRKGAGWRASFAFQGSHPSPSEHALCLTDACRKRPHSHRPNSCHCPEDAASSRCGCYHLESPIRGGGESMARHPSTPSLILEGTENLVPLSILRDVL
jgi:hypothetical protein